jgi:hypothetical protein
MSRNTSWTEPAPSAAAPPFSDGSTVAGRTFTTTATSSLDDNPLRSELPPLGTGAAVWLCSTPRLLSCHSAPWDRHLHLLLDAVQQSLDGLRPGRTELWGPAGAPSLGYITAAAHLADPAGQWCRVGPPSLSPCPTHVLHPIPSPSLRRSLPSSRPPIPQETLTTRTANQHREAFRLRWLTCDSPSPRPLPLLHPAAVPFLPPLLLSLPPPLLRSSPLQPMTSISRCLRNGVATCSSLEPC